MMMVIKQEGKALPFLYISGNTYHKNGLGKEKKGKLQTPEIFIMPLLDQILAPP